MRTMTARLVGALEYTMPAHLSGETVRGGSTKKHIDKPSFQGAEVDFQELYDAMAAMRADDDEKAREQLAKLLVLVLDGSGTLIYESNDIDAKMQNFCFWKDEYQLRWYVVVNMRGRILFISPVYPGKIDDSEALQMTSFYEYAPETQNSIF